MGERELVCVTGGSGFIGSCLVQLLLRRGYSVHATVKNLNDEMETKHLQSFDDDDDDDDDDQTRPRPRLRLRLFQMDLLDYDSILAAVTGTTGVFHVASPCTVDPVHDPQRELLDPAVEGTINVLRAAKEVGVQRVVVTSSISAVFPTANFPADLDNIERCWADEQFCKENQLWYPLSKTLAEKAAWKFADEKGLDIVVVNPGTVLGPVIPPALSASMLLLLRLLRGSHEVCEDFLMGFVHVNDVALAHVKVYENKSSTGRHLCVEALSQFGDFADLLAELYPEYKVPRSLKVSTTRSNHAAKKLIDLGLEFMPIKQIIKDSVESLRSKGYLT